MWSKHLECGPYFSRAKFLSGSVNENSNVNIKISSIKKQRAFYFILIKSWTFIKFIKSFPRYGRTGSLLSFAVQLTRIVLLVETMRASDYYVPSSPCKLLNVRTIICQRYRTSIVLFLTGWHVGNRVKVLWEQENTSILFTKYHKAAEQYFAKINSSYSADIRISVYHDFVPGIS